MHGHFRHEENSIPLHTTWTLWPRVQGAIQSKKDSPLQPSRAQMGNARGFPEKACIALLISETGFSSKFSSMSPTAGQFLLLLRDELPFFF